MSPRVSILVPSYNHSAFLGAALESVIGQTYQDWELILVDDGSTDDSVEVARSFDDPRIAVRSNERNLGTYGTQQRALGLARGELIGVLNSDDLWAPDKLEKQVAALDRNPACSLCYVLGWKVAADSVPDESEDVHLDWPTREQQELLPYLLYENRILASGVLFRRSGLRFDETCRYSGDWVALIERAWAQPVACVPERLTFWRQHDTNSYRLSLNQVFEEVRVRRSIMRQRKLWFAGRANRRDIARGLAKNAMNLMALHVLLGDKPGALLASLEALRCRCGRTELKRTCSLALPTARLRRRLWHDAADALGDFDRADVRRQLSGQPDLVLHLGA